MKDEILEYIRKYVTVWPEGAINVRLDRDGEICFYTVNYKCTYDFHPKDTGFQGNGVKYTREEWEQAQTPAEVISESFSDNETKEIYTQEMFDNGVNPSVGMMVMILNTCHAHPHYKTGVIKYFGDLVVYSYILDVERCDSSKNLKFKSINTRTDKEKAIDKVMLENGTPQDRVSMRELLDNAYDEWVGK